MKESYVDVVNLRRRVYAEVARVAYSDTPIEELETAAYRLYPGHQGLDPAKIFRERAIAEEMIRLALGLSVREFNEYKPVIDGFDEANIDENIFDLPVLDVIKFACESCPTRHFKVTDNCRSCMAHPCTNVCPVNAVSMGENGAVIDQDKCIKCGRCLKTCPYHSIIDTDRPCAAVCGVGAIGSDQYGRAEIDHDKCVACGRCVTECPFGAIGDKSQIYQLVRAIKSKKRVYAIIAPAYIGQFGALTRPAQIKEAIKQLGFQDMIEVGLGADYTTLHEAKEYLEEVPEKRAFMGTSCCYSWSLLIDYFYPEFNGNVSDTGSPMRYTAEHIKADDPEAVVCFIGPCTSKKAEAIESKVRDYVDFVITFEELMAMFVAKDIEPSEIEVEGDIQESSASARGYASAGGVAAAVKQAAEALDPSRTIKVEGASTLQECMKLLQMAKAGLKDGYLLEGMACPGGCRSGMGTIASTTRVKKEINKYMGQADFGLPFDNALIKNDKLRSRTLDLGEEDEEEASEEA
ncbi:MAG: 4Fe-4S dicluster domain-containing protein [Tissierellia bacterium]|nr:4Fe-4S dicluster domain-containing protein [Tissierellia bacterium]